jgi:hypothetical protein
MNKLVRLFKEINQSSIQDSSIAEDKIEKLIDNIANELMNRYLISTSDKLCRIEEIEFYYYSINHPDPYVHRNKRQTESCMWYLHRFKLVDSFLRFSRNGMDITFGDKIENIYASILIRKISNISTKETINGINRVVKYLLSDISKNDITILATENIDIFDYNCPLHLKKINNSNFSLVSKSIRKGLTFKNDSSYEKYFNKKYYYFFK